MDWIQNTLRLQPRLRGFHLITAEIVQGLAELRSFQMGILHIFIQHTSASLTINENADSDVRADLEMALNEIVPETLPFVHTVEGTDDMPAHVKSSLMGQSLSIPIRNGRLALGTWQGIYLCEHRDHPTPRTLILTAWGKREDNRPCPPTR